MRNAANINTSQIKTRRSWVLILFGAFFLAAALFMLLIFTLPTITDAIRMQSWQPAQATLTAAEVTRHRSDKADTYKATARYRYTVNGVNYENDRVALGRGSDNVGDFQESFGQKLEQNFYQHRPITIYYDPDNPQDAIIHRDIRWKLLFMQSFIALVFGLPGLGIMYWGWRGRKTNTSPAVSTHPWLANPAWMDNRILSDSKTGVTFMAAFATFWNLFSWGNTILILPDAWRKEGAMVAAIILLFPVVGLVLAWIAWRMSRQWRKFGKTPLQLMPFPGVIGGDVGGTIHFRQRLPQQEKYRVTLDVVKTRKSHDGNDEQLIWQKEGTASLKPGLPGSELWFRFQVPDDLPESDPPDTANPHIWRLSIGNKSIGLDRSFEIPVYKEQGAKHSSLQHSEQPDYSSPLDQQTERTGASHIDIREYLPIVSPTTTLQSNIRYRPGTIIHYPAFRQFTQHILFTLFGGFFFAIGVWLWQKPDAPMMIGLIFCLLGSLTALAGLYSLGHSLTTTFDNQHIRAVRKIFGLAFSHKAAPLTDIETITSKESYRSKGSGDRNWTIHYNILANLKNGKKIKIASAESETAATLIRDYFIHQFGLTTAG